MGRHPDVNAILQERPITEPESFAALERRGWAEEATAVAYARDFALASEMAVPALVAECGAERGGALLRPQPEENEANIRAAVVTTIISNHGPEGPWGIPLPSVVISGQAL